MGKFRSLLTAVLVAGLAACTASSNDSEPKRSLTPPKPHYACYNSAGLIESTRQAIGKKPVCAHPTDRIFSWPATAVVAPVAKCIGVPITRGQADIDANPPGTTFCVSGTRVQWTLIPKAGTKLVGDPTNPGVLDGQNAAQYAIIARPGNPGVEISNLEIKNYMTQSQRGAIVAVNDIPSGWILRNLQVHDNGSVGIVHPDADSGPGGAGANVGPGWQILGGRYYNNRQTGLGGGGATGAVIDGVEIDHNNFTDNTYTKQNIDCGFEAGGFKWAVTNGITIKNSKIHDNACKGLWADISGNGAVITNNQVYNNWDEGIFIEISSNAKITGNNVYGNGHRSVFAPNCTIFLWGGGISLAASDNVEVSGNTVKDNCMGIVGIQQTRPDGVPGLLQNINIHDNSLIGPRNRSGQIADNGSDLTTRNIVWTNNSFTNGATYCGYAC